jgi:hypothetical protein
MVVKNQKLENKIRDFEGIKKENNELKSNRDK